VNANPKDYPLRNDLEEEGTSAQTFVRSEGRIAFPQAPKVNLYARQEKRKSSIVRKREVRRTLKGDREKKKAAEKKSAIRKIQG